MYNSSGALDVDDLPQTRDHLDELLRVLDDHVDGLVCVRYLIHPLLAVTVLDAFHPLGQIGSTEPPLGLVPGEPPACAVWRTAQADWVALAAHDVRASAHGAGNDTHDAQMRVDGALARHPNFFACVTF